MEVSLSFILQISMNEILMYLGGNPKNAKYIGVSENRGTPKSSIYKKSILGYLYFWKHPYIRYITLKDFSPLKSCQ